MGMPVELWCTENFNRIAKFWGKMIKMDDRKEESKSFTTARFLVDCFQWERVHEWISMKVDDRVFDVFAKEFGSEVYSVQLHLDLVEVCSTSLEKEEKSGSVSVVEETPTDFDESPVKPGHNNSKILNVVDPLLESIINCNLNVVQDLNHGCEITEVEIGEVVAGITSLAKIPISFDVRGIRSELLGFDPMEHEAQLVHIGSTDRIEGGYKEFGPNGQERVANRVGELESGSTNSCPYQPGFEPWVNQTHTHREDVVNHVTICISSFD
ncbi:hypothetical protein PIB30_105597 [Stylosanthes scabra]|uniref:DUF4283 domain-containing protein n=1 Tax=Stylosanthes scabra TaxID=79078 RepID=A0ABU6WZI3_9FABA|nr:hypothetical protein [Stylosanthes scabra]